MKICARCDELKPVSSFTPQKGGDGYKARCRLCREATRSRAKESAARMVKYHATNGLLKQQEYQKNNREKYRAACVKWRAANPEKQKAASAAWNAANSDKNAAAAHRYYTRKRKRMPAWLTAEQRDQIDSFYLLARAQTEQTGIKHHVDHIVPLHGETVCGLHVPWNLQVLSARENIIKGNRL